MPGTKKTGKTKKAPVSSHPIFPVVVALWFAALLGLGSLILPVIVFEKLAVATGFASAVEAAQPPLGTTARLIIAAFAALTGGIAGVFLARKVASAQASAPVVGKKRPSSESAQAVERSYTPSKKKPISAHEELGEDGLDAPLNSRETEFASDEANNPLSAPKSYHGKRRSLAVTDDSGPSEFLDHAPLPGGMAQFDVQEFEEPFGGSEPLELAELALDDEPSPFGSAPEETHSNELANRPFDQGPADSSRAFVDFHGLTDEPTADADDQLPQEFNVNNDQTPPSFAANGHMAPADPQANREPSAAYNPFAQAPGNAQNFERPFAQSREPVPAAAPGAVPTPVQDRKSEATNSALLEMSMAELVARFAAALQSNAEAQRTAAHAPKQAEEPAETSSPLVFRRSNSASQAATSAPLAAQMPHEAAPVAAHSEAPSQPEFVPQEPAFAPAAPAAESPAAVPFALRPFDHEEDDDDSDDLASLSLSLNSQGLSFGQAAGFSGQAMTPPFSGLSAATEGVSPSSMFANPASGADQMTAAPSPALPAQHDEPEDETHAETEQESAYSSLLNMKSQFGSGQEFVRIEDDDIGGSSIEPLVVFPGQDGRRATPAADGPTRDPVSGGDGPDSQTAPFRPFDRPAPENPPRINPQPNGNDAGETERALREALEKLQRMSGAA